MDNRGFDANALGNEIWPMGLDMDFGFDGTCIPKNSNPKTHSTISTNQANSYNDMPQSFFQKLDDFKDNIFQITDLTNSLHKGDAESAQVVLNKIGCQELEDISGTVDCLPINETNVLTNSQEFETSNGKSLYLPRDVYGKVSYYNGKVVLQLRLLQENSNQFTAIGQCWLCQERIDINLPNACHRHSLHGIFIANTEYVQFDVDSFTHANTNMDFGGLGRTGNFPVPEKIPCVNPFAENRVHIDPAQNTIKMHYTNQFPVAESHRKLTAVSCHENSVNSLTVSNGKTSTTVLPHVSHLKNNLHTPQNPQNTASSHTPGPVITNDQLTNKTFSCLPASSVNMSSSLSVGSQIDSNYPTNFTFPKNAEVGARKRKTRAHKKASLIQMTELSETQPKQANFESNTDHLNSSNNSLAQEINKPKVSEESVASAKDTLIKKSPKVDIKKRCFKLVCYVCSKSFKHTQMSLYKEHIHNHGISSMELFSCSYCPQKFATLKPFSQHLKAHKVKSTTCSLCGSTYSRLDKLKRHMDAVHFHRQRHQCKVCLKKFTRGDSLQKHMNLHTNVRFKCDMCEVTCSSKSNLQTHKKTHLTSRALRCELCDETFSRKGMLDRHMEKDHKNTKFGCDICKKLFSRADVLKRHRKIHDSIQTKFTCDICSKEFSRKDKLKSHSKVHKSTASNKCPHCPAAFKKKDVFHKHLNIHKTKEQCNICYKFLPTPARLQAHLCWHERQIKLNFERKYFHNYKCDNCSKEFSSPELVARHVARVHANGQVRKEAPVEREKKFFCESCSKGFTRSCNLKAHMKTHKSAEDDEISELPSVIHASKGHSLKARRGTTSYLVERQGTSLESQPGMLLDFDANKYQHLAYPHVLPQPEENHLPYPAYPYNSSAADIHIPSINVNSSPSSPINLSTDAITAAAYLLAYPY